MIKRMSRFSVRNRGDPINFINTKGISGATIHDIKVEFKRRSRILDRNIPLLIFVGTNDIFKGTTVNHMNNQVKSLVKLITRLYPGIPIILSELPAFPKGSPAELHRAKLFNKFLSTLASPDRSIVIFPSQLIMVQRSHFQRYYPDGRIDLIHFSTIGNRVFLTELYQFLKLALL